MAYARQKCNPCLSAEAHTLLVNRYVTMRENMRKQAVHLRSLHLPILCPFTVSRQQETGVSVIPITVRQLEAIIRISESLARMQLSPVGNSFSLFFSPSPSSSLSFFKNKYSLN